MVFFQSFVVFGFNGAQIIPAFFSEQLKERQKLCYFQASSFMFLGNSLQISWFFVIVNLYRRVCMTGVHEIKAYYLMILTVLISLVVT